MRLVSAVVLATGFTMRGVFFAGWFFHWRRIPFHDAGGSGRGYFLTALGAQLTVELFDLFRTVRGALRFLVEETGCFKNVLDRVFDVL